MPIELSVISGRGKPQTLQLNASSVEDATAQAARLGYSVLAVNGLRARRLGPSRLRHDGLDVVVLIEQLRDLLGAGLSVIESLETLRRGATGQAASSIEALERSLREGKSLSETFADSGLFSGLLIALVRASELTSELPQTLTRFLEHERRVAEVRHRLVATAMYPSLLIAVGGLVLLFLLFYVMPRFARIFEGIQGNLPWSARAMVTWAGLLQSSLFWWVIGGAGLLLAGFAVVLVAKPESRAMLVQTSSAGGHFIPVFARTFLRIGIGRPACSSMAEFHLSLRSASPTACCPSV